MTTTFSRGGYKYTDGRRYVAVQEREFPSRSSPAVYRAIIWEDGDTSCNCRGWVIHKRCLHVNEMQHRACAGEYGRAMQVAVSTHIEAVANQLRELNRAVHEAARLGVTPRDLRGLTPPQDQERVRTFEERVRGPMPNARVHGPDPDTTPKPKRDDDKPPEPGRRRIRL